MSKSIVKFHLSEKGPAPCRASVRSCPVGGEHFSNFNDARKKYEEINGASTLKVNKKILQLDLSGEEWSERFSTAPTYQKQAVVKARVAERGEHLVTRLKDGTVETERTLEGGEVIVTNPGGEEYAVSSDKFNERYERLPNGDYRASGKIKAIPNPTGKNITITAPWGEDQFGDENCMIADNGSGDRYIIGGSEFDETYKIVEDEVSGKSIGGKVQPFAGGRYYGVHVNNGEIYGALEKFKADVGVDKFNEMRRFKRQRDRGEVYHMTVVSPNEMASLPKDITTPTATIKYKGVGKAVDGDNEAYFIVCESGEINEWRKDIGLPPKDLHITLGFMNKDVHNKSKGVDSLID